MDKSVNKGMELLEVKRCDAAIKKIRTAGRICVKGFDTGLTHDDVECTLTKLFASYGEITDVFIRVLGDNSLSEYALIYFSQEESVDKSMQLNGKDVGGWIAKLDDMRVPDIASDRSILMVKGYDTSLKNKVIKNALRKHFSSCGRVTEVMVLKSTGKAVVRISGEQAAEKALELSVFYIQGREVVSQLVYPTSHTNIVSRLGRYERPGKKAKMTVE